MVPDTSGAGDTVQIYSTYHQGTASIYAIKDANGDMVPVSVTLHWVLLQL